MSYDKPTRTYRDTHLAKGWTTKAVYRALKRAVAREIYRALAGRCEVPDYSDLPAGPRTSPSPPSRPNSGSGPPASGSSNSADAETTNSPTATEPGSTPLDNV